MLTNFIIPNKTQVLEREYIDSSITENIVKISRVVPPEYRYYFSGVHVFVYEPNANADIAGKVLMTPEGLPIDPVTHGEGIMCSVLKENNIYTLTISFRNWATGDIEYLKTKLLTKHDITQGMVIENILNPISKNKPYRIHYIPKNIEETQNEEYKEIYGHYPYEHTTEIVVAINQGTDNSGWYGIDIDHREDDDTITMK